MNTRAFLFVFAFAALIQTAPAIIVINSDETENLAAPPDGSPWNYVGRLENHLSAPASAIYLGNRYVVTASHVIEDSHLFVLNGVGYPRDTSFTQVTLQNTDMRILRIVGDPGLPPLPLIDPNDSEFNQPCTIMGYGVGKATPVPNQGWNWGDDTTRLKRWATNNTLGTYRVFSNQNQIITSFDRSAGNREGQLTSGDSGGALFIKVNGVWKFAGLAVDVDINTQALYDTDPNTPGDQPDHSYYVSVKQVLSQIRAIVPATTTPIENWRISWFGSTANTGNSADLADPNGNAIVNLLEYAFNGDPKASSTSPDILPQVGINAGNNALRLTFTRYLDRTDLTLTVKAADSPTGPWTDLARSTAGGAFAILQPGATVGETGTGSIRAVTVTDLFPITDPAHPKRFLRLEVAR